MKHAHSNLHKVSKSMPEGPAVDWSSQTATSAHKVPSDISSHRRSKSLGIIGDNGAGKFTLLKLR